MLTIWSSSCLPASGRNGLELSERIEEVSDADEGRFLDWTGQVCYMCMGDWKVMVQALID